MTTTVLADWIGYVAAFCTTIAFVPQAWRVWKTGSTRDLSLAMFAIFTVGVALWLVYGLCVHSGPVVVANAITFVLAGYILTMKLREKRP